MAYDEGFWKYHHSISLIVNIEYSILSIRVSLSFASLRCDHCLIVLYYCIVFVAYPIVAEQVVNIYKKVLIKISVFANH